MTSPWNILVVDDEDDVHAVTQLALRRRLWLGRAFAVESARSAAEARQLLENHPRGHYHAALVDVVMETETAGLELCRHIRRTQPPHLRLILRTGQPGVAPEDTVLSEYDVDHYLAKAEATRDRLYGLIRACLRSGRDIATLSAFGDQLRGFARALQNLSSIVDLPVFMEAGLAFLESKHSAKLAFFSSLDPADGMRPIGGVFKLGHDPEAIRRSIRDGMKAHPAMERFHPLPGAESGAYFVSFQSALEPGEAEGQGEELGALHLKLDSPQLSDNREAELMGDIQLFLENWRIAYRTLKLKERLARERLLRERMYLERVQAIANMVTGIAHEMNTPLGVANTASSMVRSLADELLSGELDQEGRVEIARDLRHSCELLEKNITRAHKLIASFKQLSASQLSDERNVCDLGNVIADCVEAMVPVLKKKQVTVELHRLPSGAPGWEGYPGHLSQCIVNFLTNTLRYGYPDVGGTVDIRISLDTLGGAEAFRIAYSDYGKGIAADILPHLFEPFTTSGRAVGGTGLGLAIVHNIVINLLGGTIEVATEPGRGARFTLLVPRRAPEPDASAGRDPRAPVGLEALGASAAGLAGRASDLDGGEQVS